MMLETTEKRFIQHFVTVLKEQMGQLSAISQAPNEFEAGKSIAYHEVAGLVIECSKIFNIRLEELGVRDFEPDDLL